MEPKKISFGFSKISKKPNLLSTKESAKPVSKVELIKCLEGQEIKLVEEQPEKKPLTIPLKDSQRTSTALASLLKRRAVLLGEQESEEKDGSSIETSIVQNDDKTEDIEKRAARELLAEVQKNISSDQRNDLVLPVLKADDLPLEGAIESTLDDYESIPIQDFGKAMLRGMGWTEPLPKTDKKGGLPIDDTPMVRPKGMGLGADKSLAKKTLLVAPEANEVLEIKRNAFVRILGGKYKDLYGQIEGFDDHAGRVIVKLAIGGSKEAFNEFLCQPISKKEYAQYAKCINSTKYDEYKKKENEFGQIILDKDEKNLVLKKEKKYSANDKYKHDDKNLDKYEHSRKEEKYIKQEKDSIRKKEENRNRIDDHEYEIKNHNKKEDRCRNTSSDRWVDGDKYYGRKYDDRSPGRGNHRDDDKYCRREDDRNKTIKLKKDVKDERHRNPKGSEISPNTDRQTKYDRSHYKTVDYSSDSERDFKTSKHKKKSKKSHSKKSKKSKSKYKDTSTDTESTSYTTDSSSDSEQERTKKHKKKTKKSKKQRERSPSRARR